MPRTLAAAQFPARVQAALRNQLQTVGAELSRQLRVVVQETVLELDRQTAASRPSGMQSTVADSIRRLQAGHADFASRFLQDLEAAVADMRAPRVTRRLQDLTAPSGGLSLVDEREMDEGAVLGSIAARSESRCSLALQLMGHRYGVLAGAPAFDAEHLPLGPNAVCHALRAAASTLLPSLEARVLLYRQFEKIAMAHYPALLETLNARLADDGILPHLSFIPVRARIIPPADDVAAQPHTHAGAPMPSKPEAGFANLQALLAKRRGLLAKLRPGGGDEREREQLSSQDVLAALRRMRANDTRRTTPTEIRQTLLAQARQSRGRGVALADADNDTFELFGLFVAQLQRELRANSPGEAMIARLKLPLLQLALRDQRFFFEAQHPGRMLLDAVSLAGARWLGEDDADPQWLGLLQRATDGVLEDPDASHDTFMAANHALQGGLQAAARKFEMAERRQVEAARGRERLLLARQHAADEIARAVAGRPLPRFHALLLDQAWADVLALAHLRHGEASEAWRDLRDMTGRIVEACMPEGLAAPDPALLARLQDALGQVGYHAEDAAAIARQLGHGHAGEEDLASRTELIVQLRARARLGEDNVATAGSPDTPLSEPEEAARSRLAGLNAGCWIDLPSSVDDVTVRRRLAWVGARSGQVVLLNRRGLRVADGGLDGIARALAAGDARLHADDPHPAECAWEATMANLRRIADEPVAEARHGQ